MTWFIPLSIVAAWYWLNRPAAQADPSYVDDAPDVVSEASTMADQIASVVNGSPADYFSTSEPMRARIKRREGLRLAAYRLGDGGWTIGYGRYYPDGGEVPPGLIDQATAERWFDDDLVNRGEKWVKLYVSVPINQAQFDALVSMAYNLRPSSFKTIAQAVNDGQDPAPVAMQYTRPGTNLEAGLVARRNEELGIFNGTLQA